MVLLLWKTYGDREVHQKIKNITYYSAIPLLRIDPKEMKMGFEQIFACLCDVDPGQQDPVLWSQ